MPRNASIAWTNGDRDGIIMYIQSDINYTFTHWTSPPIATLCYMTLHGEREWGQVQFVRTTLRAVPANWTCLLFPL